MKAKKLEQAEAWVALFTEGFKAPNKGQPPTGAFFNLMGLPEGARGKMETAILHALDCENSRATGIIDPFFMANQFPHAAVLRASMPEIPSRHFRNAFINVRHTYKSMCELNRIRIPHFNFALTTSALAAFDEAVLLVALGASSTDVKGNR